MRTLSRWRFDPSKPPAQQREIQGLELVLVYEVDNIALGTNSKPSKVRKSRLDLVRIASAPARAIIAERLHEPSHVTGISLGQRPPYWPDIKGIEAVFSDELEHHPNALDVLARHIQVHQGRIGNSPRLELQRFHAVEDLKRSAAVSAFCVCIEESAVCDFVRSNLLSLHLSQNLACGRSVTGVCQTGEHDIERELVRAHPCDVHPLSHAPHALHVAAACVDLEQAGECPLVRSEALALQAIHQELGHFHLRMLLLATPCLTRYVTRREPDRPVRIRPQTAPFQENVV
eukprot:scaffold29_cov251-Pinguiococcus_pyrenoidosus.AAC.39